MHRTNESNKVQVLPAPRRGFVRAADPQPPTLAAFGAFGGVLVAQLGGRPVALPLCACLDVLIDDGRAGFGRVRYVAADGVIAVNFGCDPLNHVWEFPAERCRATTVRSSLALIAIRAHLAAGPEVTADLDVADTAGTALRILRAA